MIAISTPSYFIVAVLSDFSFYPIHRCFILRDADSIIPQGVWICPGPQFDPLEIYI